jgi:hypothetical protein
MQALIKFFRRWYVCVPAITFAATFVLIAGSNLLSLHAFGTTTLFSITALSVVLSVAALVLLTCVGAPVMDLLKLSGPGLLLQTVFGIISGSLALMLVGRVLPHAILIGGLSAIPFATANTMLIWALSYLTGTLPKTHWLPKRRDS